MISFLFFSDIDMTQKRYKKDTALGLIKHFKRVIMVSSKLYIVKRKPIKLFDYGFFFYAQQKGKVGIFCEKNLFV